MAAFSGTLALSDETKASMEDQGFTEDDIREVIGAAEETGVKLRNEDSTEFIAKLKIDETYIYAQYTTDGEGFSVSCAYALKTWAEGW